jgi:hypothetical protein
MDKNYYYFVAQLPSLQYGEPAPYTPEEFLEQCQTMLTKRDYEELRYCTTDITVLDEYRPGKSDFLNAWVTRERTFCYTLAQLRSDRLKRNHPEEGDGLDSPRAAASAHAVFAMGNPLEAELSIDKDRWETIEAIQGNDLFSVNVIFVHLLKLKILQRHVLFNKEAGQAAFDSLYNTILQEADKASGAGTGKVS